MVCNNAKRMDPSKKDKNPKHRSQLRNEWETQDEYDLKCMDRHEA